MSLHEAHGTSRGLGPLYVPIADNLATVTLAAKHQHVARVHMAANVRAAVQHDTVTHPKRLALFHKLDMYSAWCERMVVCTVGRLAVPFAAAAAHRRHSGCPLPCGSTQTQTSWRADPGGITRANVCEQRPQAGPARVGVCRTIPTERGALFTRCWSTMACTPTLEALG